MSFDKRNPLQVSCYPFRPHPSMTMMSAEATGGLQTSTLTNQNEKSTLLLDFERWKLFVSISCFQTFALRRNRTRPPMVLPAVCLAGIEPEPSSFSPSRYLILLPLNILYTWLNTKYSSPSRYMISCTWYSIHYAICGSRHDGPHISVVRRREMSFRSWGSNKQPLGDIWYICDFNNFWKLLLDTLPPQGTSHLIVDTWLDNCPPQNLILD